MAVTLVSQPTTPNVTGTKLVFEVSGSDTSHPQYAYVMDIYLSGSEDRIYRAFQQPNPAGVGQFNPAQVLQGQLNYDNDWKITNKAEPTNSVKTFDLRFGEAYGTSTSSSLTIYTGSINNYLQVFPGTLDPNIGGYNWLGSGSTQVLTNMTEGYLAKGNYATIPVYLPSGSQNVNIIAYPFESQSVFSPTSTDKFYNIPIGSGSLDFTYFDSNWNYIEVKNGSTVVSTIYRQGGCFDGQVTFAFINKYGFYDYYTATNPLKRSTDVEKRFVSLPKVDYSSNISTYSYETGGEKDYYTNRTDKYEIETEYLNYDTAVWLEELLESPEVYVQQNGELVPIIITNSEYTHNNSQGRNKLFKYTIELAPSNGRELTAQEVDQGYIPPTPSPTPTATPTPTPSITPSPTPTPTVTPTGTPTPTPSTLPCGLEPISTEIYDC